MVNLQVLYVLVFIHIDYLVYFFFPIVNPAFFAIEDEIASFDAFSFFSLVGIGLNAKPNCSDFPLAPRMLNITAVSDGLYLPFGFLPVCVFH